MIGSSNMFLLVGMSSALWRMYADHLFYRWEKNVVWEMVEPYRRPKSFTPVLSIYVAAFYTGVIGAAVTEQLYKVTLPSFLLSSVCAYACQTLFLC